MVDMSKSKMQSKCTGITQGRKVKKSTCPDLTSAFSLMQPVLMELLHSEENSHIDPQDSAMVFPG